jgi:beta-lactamase regulating signal transducer with metallopeptidase domain
MGGALAAATGMDWLLSAAMKAALLLAVAGIGAALVRRGTAAARHQMWALGVVGALVVPILSGALPSLPLPSLLPAPTTDAGSSLLMPAIFVTGERTTGGGMDWVWWLAIGWAAGTLLVSIRFVRGHLAAHRLARTAEPACAEAWLAANREAASALGIAGAIRLGRSEAVRSPMTMGVLRPRVILPAAADGWSPERLRAVLLHELGHVRRRDTLVQLGAQLACALYWWNPLAWLAAVRLRIEREHACDDLVLGAGIRPSSYAADLLEVARCVSRPEAAHAGAVCMADRSWTEARLRRILDADAPRRPLGAGFRLTARGAMLACAVTLACTAAPLAPPTPSGPASAAAGIAPGAGNTGDARAAKDAHAGASRGALSIGAPSVNGEAFRPPALAPEDTIDLSLVAAEVKRNLGGLQQCYERRLLVRPELSGEVAIHWVISPTGKVTEQCITTDTVGDAEITACVNQLIAEATFPAPRGAAVDVTFPFVFTALR